MPHFSFVGREATDAIDVQLKCCFEPYSHFHNSRERNPSKFFHCLGFRNWKSQRFRAAQGLRFAFCVNGKRLNDLSFAVLAEQVVAVRYKGLVLDGGYRLDLVVEDLIIVELKSVETVLPVHHAQLLSYLRLTNKPLGLLINFNVPVLVNGVKRIVNGF
jgi:GxxExxY protein